MSDRSENVSDLAVAYRVYPGLGRPGPIYHDDKYKRVRLCLDSFKKAVRGLKVKIHLILDGCPEAYGRLFRDHFDAVDLEVVECDREGNLKTFARQVHWLTSQTHSDCVYFAEDDYFYFPDAIRQMRDALARRPEMDFITPLDHRDYHSKAHHAAPRERISEGSIRWKSVASTCLTFMTRKSTLMDAQDLFLSYSLGCSDVGLWFAITRYRLFQIGLYALALRGQRHALLAAYHGWRFGFLRLLSGKKGLRLYAPEPTLAAHLENQSLPPGMDWRKILDQAAVQLDNPDRND